MIKAIIIVNNQGKPRLTQFFGKYDTTTQQEIVKEIFQLVVKRPGYQCNFLEGSHYLGGNETRLIYRHYATLYFVFAVDASESELGTLDLIQAFVEALDTCFEDVNELDILFHLDKVQYILQEIVQGGLVADTNVQSIVDMHKAQEKYAKQHG